MSYIFAMTPLVEPTSYTSTKALESNAVTETYIDWRSFLSRHDLLWKALPRHWYEGAFVGNGLLGAMIYGIDSHTLTLDVGRSDIVETKGQSVTVTPRTLNEISRLNVGHLLLKTKGTIQSGEVRVDLWNAEAIGSLQTGEGNVYWRCFAASNPSVLVIDVTTSGNEKAGWQWRPGLAVPPHKLCRNKPVLPDEMNPMPIVETVDGNSICMQSLKAGGAYSTAYRVESRDEDRSTCFLSVGWSRSSKAAKDSVAESISHLSEAKSQGLETLVKNHRKWWHNFYPQSFISIPDLRMESFYWIQIYKLGSAMRQNTPPADLLGPWFKMTVWPAFWWNMNIQLGYMPQLTSNRMELGEPFLRMLDDNIENLIKNVKPEFQADSAGIGRASTFDCRSEQGPELHSLPWACHVYWLYCEYSNDKDLLKRFYPLLKRSITLLIHHLEVGSDNRLHMMPSSVNEGESLRDANLTMGPLKWGLKTLIECANRLKVDTQQISEWKDILNHLAPYAVDDNGLMLGEGAPSKLQLPRWNSRSNYGFMLPIYPFHDIDADIPDERQIIEKTINEWLGCSNDWEGFHAYNCTAIASLFSLINRNDEISKWLNVFLDTRVDPNTMYEEGLFKEEDKGLPCLEGGFTFCLAIHDMLLQSWNAVLRIFPGVPYSWKDVTFHQLRGEGAFLVSASRKGGFTDWVSIKSLKGCPCRVKVDFKDEIEFIGERDFEVENDDGILSIDLKEGESILLKKKSYGSAVTVSPVESHFGPRNYWGTKNI